MECSRGLNLLLGICMEASTVPIRMVSEGEPNQRLEMKVGIAEVDSRLETFEVS